MTALIYLALVVAIFAGGTWTGIEWQQGRQAKADLAQVAEDKREEQRLASRIDRGAVAHEVEKVRIEKVFQNIETEVEHVVTKVEYRNQCFDDDGMRQLTRAIAAVTQAASQPTPAVSSPVRPP